ncbi:MAG: bifunctional diguanylate cyclase/phosphodiesterase [Cellvibrionaceae bacterium]|nr:bifunctional diguanylate cyclase/phosphodiesterase [Cellvibrionaceae bacterium]
MTIEASPGKNGSESILEAVATLSDENQARGNEAVEAALRNSSLLDLSDMISVDSNFNRDLKFIHKNVRFSIDIHNLYLLRQTRGMYWEYKCVLKQHRFCREEGWKRIPTSLNNRVEVLVGMRLRIAEHAAANDDEREPLLQELFGSSNMHFESFRYDRGGVLFTPSDETLYTEFDKSYLSNIASIISFCVEKDSSGRFLADVYQHLQNTADQVKAANEEDVSASIPTAYLEESSGLPNQAGLIRLMHHLIDSACEKFYLVVLSIDKFAYFCNLFDSETKQKLLAKTVARIQSVLGQNSSLSHIGHSELAFIVLDTDESSVVQSIHEITNAFSEDVQVDDVQVRFEISAGLCSFPDCEQSAETLLKMANVALYRATQKSSERLVAYRKGMENALRLHVELGRSIRQAIDRDEFEVFFQPIVGAEEGSKVCHFESLVRWIHPAEGMISPALFIEIAEASGDIIHLGYWVVERVCQHLVKPEVPNDIQVSINLSPVQLRESKLADRMLEILQKYGVSAERISFEITETAAMLDPSLTRQRFDELNRAGFQLSVDDFGTGHSSLSYLLNFSFKYLKIDKSFIDQSGTDEGYAVIAGGMINMAHQLGMTVICEGIETQGQREMVRRWGADYIQGYLIDKPSPIDYYYQK